MNRFRSLSILLFILLIVGHAAGSLARVDHLILDGRMDLAEEELRPLLADKYASAGEVVWCQEEPKNQGAWYATNHHIAECMAADQRLRYAGRPAAASPAVGSPKLHHEQQRALVEAALG